MMFGSKQNASYQLLYIPAGNRDGDIRVDY